MARIRTHKPEFWTDAKTGRLSTTAKCLFLGLLNLADDYGIVAFDLEEWRARLFPYDNPDDARKAIQAATVDELLPSELLALFSYQADDDAGPSSAKQYVHIVNFLKHQAIDRPSKPTLPDWRKDDTISTYAGRCESYEILDDPSPIPRRPLDDSSANDRRALDELSTSVKPLINHTSTSTRRALDEHSTLERKGKEGKRKGGEGRRSEPSTTTQPEPPKAPPGFNLESEGATQPEANGDDDQAEGIMRFTGEVWNLAQMRRGVLLETDIVANWLKAGAKPKTILEVVGVIAQRPTYQPPRSLSYFTKAVLAEATGQVEGPTNMLAKAVPGEADWVNAAKTWVRGGEREDRWIESVMPGWPTSKVTPEMLARARAEVMAEKDRQPL